MLSTETSNSSKGSIMDGHINGHSNTVKGVQLSDGVVPLIKDANLRIVLLLVELTVNLVNNVLGIPAISQPGQKLDQNGWKPSRTMSHS
jgi:hypothetical protein